MGDTCFCLIRHGKQSYAEVERRNFIGMGLEMAPLNEVGQQQALESSKDSRFEGSEIIISSPYTRALQTAAILSRQLDLEIKVEVDLRERNLDLSCQAKSLDELLEIGKDETRAESMEAIRYRVKRCLANYKEYKRVIVVTHGFVIHSLTGTIGIPNCSIYEYKLPVDEEFEMNSEEERRMLKEYLKKEESKAFKGWDFSYLSGRWNGEEIPWDYKRIVKQYLKSTDHLLDMGTGGGEFLLTLQHPYKMTSVTEAYPPNVKLCEEKLSPLGITVKQVIEDDRLPFQKNEFDVVINRHESFDVIEVCRILKKGGYFISQQVGGKNDYELSYRLIKDFTPQFPQHDLAHTIELLKSAGFEILFSEESYSPVRFYDLGAIVYFAKIIEWEFPGFSVENCFDNLCTMQKEFDLKGYIEGTEHRFIVAARKM